MTLKEYLKNQKITLRYLSEAADVPYTNVYELVNGKVDIDQCRFGNIKSIAEACRLSLDDLYAMCKEKTALPAIDGGVLFVKNKQYYLRYEDEKGRHERPLCKVNENNRPFLSFMAEMELKMIKQEREIEEVENWTHRNN